METRPATREELLKLVGRRFGFETYVREVSDRRTSTGVRHITRSRSKIQDIGGVPMVRRLGEMCELFGVILIGPDGREWSHPVLTIIKPEHRSMF